MTDDTQATLDALRWALKAHRDGFNEAIDRLERLLDSQAKDQEQQERETRRQRFNVAAEAVERRKAEMTAAELKYRRATATPDHPLAEPDPEVERRAAVRALREAVADMRRAREGSWNLRDPRDPEVAYSVDVWLEVRANRLAETELEKIDAAEAEGSRPATGYKVGDPDPTPNLDEPEGYCDEPSPSAAFCCTWGTGHPGLPHIAGDGIKILAVWPQHPPEPSREEREARRRRFNVNAEAVEHAKDEMTAEELKYRRATATPDHPLAEPGHTGNGSRPHFSRGLSYPDPVDWTNEEEGEVPR